MRFCLETGAGSCGEPEPVLEVSLQASGTASGILFISLGLVCLVFAFIYIYIYI